MRRNFAFIVASLILLTIVLSACGSGGGGTTGGPGPADAAKLFFEAIVASDKAKATTYTCQAAAATIDQMTQSFSSLATGGGKLDVSGLKYEAANQSGDTADVKVTGNMKVSAGGQNVDVPLPGGSITFIMKNESGWKYCGGK